MAQQVVPQVDMGSLSLQSLSRFSQMLSALSADNVAPMAMIQVENLGAFFPINGSHAAKVPDLLQRCSSVRLDRLSLAVGWRKGDAASLMATSAGSQAASLLSVWLCNLLNREDAGEVLFELSQKFLPRSVAVSSMSQLGDVAQLLRCKLDALGFGNLLAQQVMRVNKAFEHLSIQFPSDFLEPLTTDTMIELPHSLSRALREEKTLVRISGSRGMGQILGIVFMMFPQDAIVTVDNTIIHEGLRRSILLEIDHSDRDQGLTRMQLETTLDTSANSPLLPSFIEHPWQGKFLYYSYSWSGWIARYLGLCFLDSELACTQDLLLACCELLIMMPTLIKSKDPYIAYELPRKGAISLLGPAPYHRMRQTCPVTYGVEPKMVFTDFSAAYSNLVSIFRKIVSCCCAGSNRIWNGDRACDCVSLCNGRWNAIRQGLDWGFLCFFIEAGPNSTCQSHIHNRRHHFVTKTVETLIGRTKSKDYDRLSCEQLHEGIVQLGGPVDQGTLAKSFGSSIIFPMSLEELRINAETKVSYLLLSQPTKV